MLPIPSRVASNAVPAATASSVDYVQPIPSRSLNLGLPISARGTVPKAISGIPLSSVSRSVGLPIQARAAPVVAVSHLGAEPSIWLPPSPAGHSPHPALPAFPTSLAGLPTVGMSCSMSSSVVVSDASSNGFLPIAPRNASLTSNILNPPLALPVLARGCNATVTSTRPSTSPPMECFASQSDRGGTPSPVSTRSAAACGADILAAALDDKCWSRSVSSSSDDSPIARSAMRKTKTEKLVTQTNSQGSPSAKGNGVRRCSAPVISYKAFFSQHGSEVSVYDRYEFGQLLGEGGAGSTWEAWPRSPDRASVKAKGQGPALQRIASGPSDGHRAIKKMLKHRMPDGSYENLLAEMEVLKKLDHPNICKIYEAFEDAQTLFLVMDLCSGGELFDRIANGELGGEARSAELVQQLAHALRYCHETHGIVHRDIKPENVLFVSTDPQALQAKLIDFGIACHCKSSERVTAGRAGTEAYEAPEIISNSSYCEKCDLWSLGVLLYVMLSGCMPFASGRHSCSGTFSMKGEDWDQTSDEAKDLISRLLVVDPEARLSAAQVLEHPWLSLCHESPQAMPMQVANRLRRYHKTSNFRKILLMLVARHLDANDLPEIYDAFTAIDKNGDGILSPEEFRASLSTVKSSDEVTELFQAVDADGSGSIDYSEFIAAAIDRKLLFREDLCLQVFRALDRDDDGKISIQELQQLLVDAAAEDFLGSELRDEALTTLNRYDADRDGLLDIREFMALLTQNRIAEIESKAPGAGRRPLALRHPNRQRTAFSPSGSAMNGDIFNTAPF